MGKVALLFPGQGAQFVGMGKDVAELSARGAAVFAQANEVVGYDLTDVCFNGPEERLQRTEVQQPAIFTTSVAIWEALLERGYDDAEIAATAGLSLGEYTALHMAGAIGFDDALKLVQRRGKLMQAAAEAHPSGMVSVMGAEASTVEALCDRARGDGVLAPANFNCPGQIVISGSLDACQRAVEIAAELGCRAIALKVAGAFHSPLMQSAADGLLGALSETPVSRTRIPVVANVSAEPHGDADSIRHALGRQVTQPVQWQRSIEGLIEDGVEAFVEIGPGRVLTGLMRKIRRGMKMTNISSADDVCEHTSASAEAAR
ncbi:MAG: ACP S-malonyltransferase [Planctomycetes bacterium]|nr:ACP S-malonyltransferase [Planctomycetota bacterium]